MPHLSQEEKVTIQVLNSKNEPHRAIARRLGVSEGTVRYHLRKVREGRGEHDGRREKVFKAREVADQIEHWLKETGSGRAEGRPANLKLLWQWLVDNCGYAGSYKSVWRYVRRHYPAPARRPYRRVELPPGVQAQVDWCERTILIAGIAVKLHGFFMCLSHSRGEGLIWRESMDQLSWQQSHNLAFVGLGGIPATVRIDNLKTGMALAGPKGTVNPVYRRYAQAAGFHVDACPVRHPEAKGKVESRIGHLVSALLSAHPNGFASVEQLQAATDAWIETQSRRRRCPATGTSVAEAWEAERALLRPAHALPEIFDTVLTRRVQSDCMVHFEGRRYSVPFNLAWQQVEVRGGPGVVTFRHAGREVARHRRGSAERILINEAHYQGEATPTHRPPLPLGRIGSKIRELAEAEVERRAVDYYHELMEVCP